MLKSGDVHKKSDVYKLDAIQSNIIIQGNQVEKAIPIERSLLKDNYEKKQRAERFSKDFKRNDLNELIFNSQMNAKKKATNWADYIDECIK